MAPRSPLLWHHISCKFSLSGLFHALQGKVLGVDMYKQRMGEIDAKAFKIACEKRFSDDADAEINSALNCSKW